MLVPKLKKKSLKMRGLTMIGALVREVRGTGIMKIVTEYKCDSKGEWIIFAGHSDWHPLDEYELLSE